MDLSAQIVAEEAANLIEIDYEVLPCVLTAPEAMQEGRKPNELLAGVIESVPAPRV